MLLSLGPAAVAVFARKAAPAAAPMDSRMTTVRTRRHAGGWHGQSVGPPVRPELLATTFGPARDRVDFLRLLVRRWLRGRDSNSQPSD